MQQKSNDEPTELQSSKDTAAAAAAAVTGRSDESSSTDGEMSDSSSEESEEGVGDDIANTVLLAGDVKSCDIVDKNICNMVTGDCDIVSVGGKIVSCVDGKTESFEVSTDDGTKNCDKIYADDNIQGTEYTEGSGRPDTEVADNQGTEGSGTQDTEVADKLLSGANYTGTNHTEFSDSDQMVGGAEDTDTSDKTVGGVEDTDTSDKTVCGAGNTESSDKMVGNDNESDKLSSVCGDKVVVVNHVSSDNVLCDSCVELLNCDHTYCVGTTVNIATVDC